VARATATFGQGGIFGPILIDAENGGYHSGHSTGRANSDDLLLSCHDGDPFLSRFNIDARARADSLDQLGAAVKAISEKARISGLLGRQYSARFRTIQVCPKDLALRSVAV